VGVARHRCNNTGQKQGWKEKKKGEESKGRRGGKMEDWLSLKRTGMKKKRKY